MGLFRGWKKGQLSLDKQSIESWPKKIISYKEIDREVDRFLRDLDRKKENIMNSLALIEIDERVPERAKHIITEYTKHLAELTERLIANIKFTTDAIAFQGRSNKALEEITRWRASTTKHHAALKEYYEKEVQTLSKAVQEIEDLIIKEIEILDEKGYDTVMIMRDLIRKLVSEKKKEEKFRKALNRYLSEKEELDKRKDKHYKKIESQRPLIRSHDASEALKKVALIEDSESKIKDRYERLVFDTKHFLLKNGLILTSETKKLFDELKKDPKDTIIRKNEALKKEFSELQKQIENIENDKRAVAERLKAASDEVSKDAKKLIENKEELHALKKAIMSDIAALNIYEQQQFLAVLGSQESDINEKIDFISEELEGMKSSEYLNEIIKAAETFQPVISGSDEL